ncbi:hypothetical protein FRC12_023636, partial [Ceratobasidium sp. 428]
MSAAHSAILASEDHAGSNSDVDVVGLSDSDPDVDVVGLDSSDVETGKSVKDGWTSGQEAKQSCEVAEWNDEEVDIMGWSDEESHIEQQAASTTSQKEDLNSFGGTFNLEDSPLLSEGLSDISNISTYHTDHYKASNPANAPQTDAS